MTLPNERIRACQKLIRLAEELNGSSITNIKGKARWFRELARFALTPAATADSFEMYFEHKGE